MCRVDIDQTMSTATPQLRLAAQQSPGRRKGPLRIGLLGHGLIGSAVAALTGSRPDALDRPIVLTSALVRSTSGRAERAAVPLTTDPEDVFRTNPDVLVEVLGGLEPARTLVLESIDRGIPVVTANKSLLAHHGDELLDAAESSGVRLCYEASVIAGVPFLCTLARRPLASSITSFTGIVNGTTNYILSEIENAGVAYAMALADAQRRGFAEPDPSKDVDGSDALEKLVVLVRQLSSCSVSPAAIEARGIQSIGARDLVHARELGGTIKPVAHAEWSGNDVHAFAGPAFVSASDPLAGLAGASNGICLRDRHGSELFFSGPGAGPLPTAVTIVDDVLEAVGEGTARPLARRRGTVGAPSTGWLIRLSSDRLLPRGEEVADLLSACGVWVVRTSSRDTRDGGEAVWLLTYACMREQAEAAARTIAAAARCDVQLVRALGARS